MFVYTTSNMRQSHYFDQEQPVLCPARGCGEAHRSGLPPKAELNVMTPSCSFTALDMHFLLKLSGTTAEGIFFLGIR